MIQCAEKQDIPSFVRGGKNVLKSGALVRIGIKEAAVGDIYCSACGSETCIVINTVDGEFQGLQCELRELDMGIPVSVSGRSKFFNR